MALPYAMPPSQPVRADICQRQIPQLRPVAPPRTEAPVNRNPSHDIDDRVRALTEELRLAEDVHLSNANRIMLVLNQERLRGALADALRLIQELRQQIADHDNRP